MAGASFLNWAVWMLSSLVGVALANIIPPEWGLGFAGILCLLGIQCSLASSRLRVLSAVVAGVTAVAAFAFPLKLNIVSAIAMAVLVCMLAEHAKPALTQGGRA
jgi:predicted branched-subunit amino acid permease